MRLFGPRPTALRSVAVNQNCLLSGREPSVPLLRLSTWHVRVHAPPSSMFKTCASSPLGAACPAVESLEPCRVVVADVLAPPRADTKSLRSGPSREVGPRRRGGRRLGSAGAHAGAQSIGYAPQLSLPSARRGVSFRPPVPAAGQYVEEATRRLPATFPTGRSARLSRARSPCLPAQRCSTRMTRRPSLRCGSSLALVVHDGLGSWLCGGPDDLLGEGAAAASVPGTLSQHQSQCLPGPLTVFRPAFHEASFRLQITEGTRRPMGMAASHGRCGIRCLERQAAEKWSASMHPRIRFVRKQVVARRYGQLEWAGSPGGVPADRGQRRGPPTYGPERDHRATARAALRGRVSAVIRGSSNAPRPRAARNVCWRGRAGALCRAPCCRISTQSRNEPTLTDTLPLHRTAYTAA